MAKSSKLKAPDNLTIDFKPSPRQYEVWKAVQPECPECGGNITMTDRTDGTADPICDNCGNDNIPQITLEGQSAL